ncbi:hypothetical protein LZ198_22900 [Myxococcus sp. K15C18031901]|uniref:hypothetical protein n=1 Tax=Myxococcus dinghuensis TaxID=2906761 RepID=UPI0020A73D0D|nr:hypothetical protein [Myxococcus dinghuensis]MCP3101730.1 hypothetical protein [Myxococcus dinghuensis]
MRLVRGPKPLQYPHEEGLEDVPVEVYGKPGLGPVVIDAGWGFLLPDNRTYPLWGR